VLERINPVSTSATLVHLPSCRVLWLWPARMGPRKLRVGSSAVPTALMPTLPTAPYSDISVVVFRQSFEAPVPDTMSPFARHKRGCGGAGSFGPGPCCPSTIQGRRALVSCSEATKTLVSLLSQGQTSAHAQEEGSPCPPSG